MGRLKMVGIWLLCLVAAALSLIWMAGCVVAGGQGARRFMSIAVALDQSANAMLGGSPDETISSRSGRRWPHVARFVNWLFGDPNHCTEAIESDRASAREILERTSN